MLEDTFKLRPPAASEEDMVPDNPATILERIESMQALASAIQKRVMPNGYSIDPKVPVREAKEAIAASTNLLNLLMRHRDELELEREIQVFKEAVAATLQEMDRDLNTRFKDVLTGHLQRLTE